MVNGDEFENALAAACATLENLPDGRARDNLEERIRYFGKAEVARDAAVPIALAGDAYKAYVESNIPLAEEAYREKYDIGSGGVLTRNQMNEVVQEAQRVGLTEDQAIEFLESGIIPDDILANRFNATADEIIEIIKNNRGTDSSPLIMDQVNAGLQYIVGANTRNIAREAGRDVDLGDICAPSGPVLGSRRGDQDVGRY